MKPIFALLIIVSLPLFAQEQSIIDNRLVVYGEGSAEASANRAQMSFVVVGFGPTIQDAMATARTKVGTILTKLKAIGLTEKNLLTSSFYSGDNAQGKAFLSSSKDFRTQMDVLITMDSLAWIDNVIMQLAGSEVERMSNVSFSLKNDSLLKVEARERAVANGHLKAQRMTAQLGVTLGRLMYLEEVFGLPVGPMRNVLQMNTTNTIRVEQPGITFYGAQRFAANSFLKLVFEIK